VGDIHGRADLLEKLLQRIEADAADLSRPAMLVFLGDYVDRGFQSRQVIDLILSERLTRFEVQCIKGNHEAAMLTFLRDPQFGPRWASYGGRETLVSYGVRPPRNVTKLDEWEAAHQEFVRVLPAAHETFLQRLPTSLRVGPYGFVHAGVKPGVPFEDQTEADLLWIREEFLRSSQPNDLVIVHGHTPVDRPHRDDRRINVDTGAYFSGRLTAVRLEADTIGFLSTEV
jgi:serine/threonine protein phosphatase 1